MKSHLAAIVTAALTLAAPLAQATVINSAYTRIGDNTWLADFTIFNDGTPTSFAGFTIDFPNATGLTLVGSPATWDSLVVQPDASIPDPGFLDSFAILSSNVLAAGQSQGGFRVSFNYAGTPGGLPFVVNNAAFAPLFTGITTVTTPIPEPSTVLMMALGLAAVGARTLRQGKRNSKELTA